jgi:hypothetical protein
MIVYDNFIKDLDLLDKISNDNKFWEPGYRWWDGWWASPIEDLRHQLIKEVWGENSPHESIGCKGFEHWVGDYNGDDEPHMIFNKSWSLKPHFDKDEEHFQKTKKVIGPKIGTVFYPCREIDDMEGGYLEYYEKYSPSRTLEDGSIVWPEEKPELIKPKWNRLIIFEAANLHAVTEIVSGRRRAIAINLWGHKPTEFSKEY